MARTASSAPRAKQPKGAERRVPRLREQVQIAYDLLRDLLRRAGYEGLLAQLQGLDTVNEVLRHRPEIVPLLQKAAWELRHEKKFSQLFLNLNTGEIVEDRDEPIAPCGRTFAEVEQAHLYGAARLFFDRLELEFATRRARAAEKEWKKEQAARRKSVAGRLVSGLRDLTQDPPRFNADDYRADYPGRGLYNVLKPHLRHDWQFRLIPLYARLRTRQAEAMDDLITFFTEPRDLETVVSLKAEDIAQARGFARAYAEAITGVQRAGRLARQPSGEDAEEQAAKLQAAQEEERRVFDLLLTRHVASLDPLRAAGAGAEATVRRLAPVFEDEVFALFQTPDQLDNAINCPDFMLRLIGTAARACPPSVSAAFTQIKDRDLAKDLLRLTVEEFPHVELEALLGDPSRLPIWNALPGKFNNNYRYQADAPTDSATLHNLDNLRTVAAGLFDSLRTGRHVELSTPLPPPDRGDDGDA